MWRMALIGMIFLMPAMAGQAAELRGGVVDALGAVKDAVIHARPLAGAVAAKPGAVSIDQTGLLYTPFVSAFPAGTLVNFPNRDNIKHHLYSVSPTEPFERPLYEGKDAEPVLFDTPGEVVLGCNIHDWMIGHVLVLDTPYSAVTDHAGRAVIGGLPPGDYEVRVWHPGMKNKKQARNNPQVITLGADPADVAFTIALKSKKTWWRKKPKNADKEYAKESDSWR